MTIIEYSIVDEILKARKQHGEARKTSSHPNYEAGCMDGLVEALDIIENHSDWIPVSEPPKEDGTYLVQTKFNTYEILDYYTCCNRWDDDAHEIKCVIAWQPLPKPYEGD